MPDNVVDEWVWRASVEDETDTFFERFDKFADDYRKKSSQAFDSSTKGANESAAAFGVLAGAVGGLTVKLLDMALQGGKALIGFTKNAVLLAARVETLGVSLNQVGKQAGYTSEEIIEAENSVKDMGITTQSARQSLLLMTRANIDWSEASKLARVAQDAAVIAGLNSSQAFERLVRGIQKQEPELLDELGITLRRTEAYGRFAAQIGKTVKQLTRAEQQQAILNEIYSQAGVVTGSYEAAMGTAGKQAASMARHIEELQLAIGNAFQPVYQEWISFMTNALKEMRQFIDENSESLKEFGMKLANAAKTGFTALLKLLEIMLKLSAALDKANNRAKEFVIEIAGEESLSRYEQWKQKVITSAGQVISIIGGIANTVLTAITEVAGLAGDYIRAVKTTLTEGAVEGGKAFQELLSIDRLKEVGSNIKNAFGEGTVATAKFLGVLDDTEPTTRKAAEGTEDLADSMSMLAEEEEKAAEETEKLKEQVDNLAKAQDALNKIRQSYNRSEADRLRQEQRAAIEAQIAQSEQAAEIERKYQDSLANIDANAIARRNDLQEDYNSSVIDAARKHSEDRLQAEEDYQERLQQIKRDFLFNSEELARARDAIGMTRLIRENKRQLEEEKRNHKKVKLQIDEDHAARLDDLKVNLTERQATLEESIQNQLDAAERAREDDYRAMEEALAKERATKALHDRWAAQDRQIALQRQLQDFIAHYGALEGVTESALNRMLGSWQRYARGVSGFASAGTGGSSGGGITDILGGYYGKDNKLSGGGFDSQRSQDILRKYYDQQQLTGQGGQVSGILARPNEAQPGLFQTPGTGVIPKTTPVSSVERREILVKVDGNALDPYMQEVVANTLYEIERNRG